jgi:hypothetical protein
MNMTVMQWPTGPTSQFRVAYRSALPNRFPQHRPGLTHVLIEFWSWRWHLHVAFFIKFSVNEKGKARYRPPFL